MTPVIANAIWCAGVIFWFIIRYPHARRSKRTTSVRKSDTIREWILLLISTMGLGAIPATYVFSGFPNLTDYPFRPFQASLGAACFVGALYLFRRTHKELGRNWSVTLELREKHSLVTRGIYARVRHPMYSAFWLWAVAQALLLPNWIAGLSGIFGFGTLFFLRVGREERLMIEVFGEEYERYMARTWRVLPGIF